MATSPKTTKYDDETLSAPQSTSPGDAPADTFDPLERVSSGAPNKAAAAASGFQTVNAVVEVAPIVPATPSGNRTESFTAPNSAGVATVYVHNYDTGKTAVPKTWTATTAYVLGDYIIRSGKVLECTTAGTSGASAPTAPGAVGGTVTDGTAVWTRRT
jgi:hypothetical protein